MPSVAYGQVFISEIMYAPQGADATHEWIEVCNTGSSADLSEWKLYENETNHSLNISSGSSTLAQGTCAIIADNATTFAADYPSFSGNLFDSVFSLKNTGETLQLKDADGTVQDDVTYSDSQGAKNNGLTLHRSGNSFVEGPASPGSEESFVANPETDTGNSGTNTTTQNITTITQYQYEALSVEPPQDIHIRLPEKLDTIVGANVSLFAEVYDARGRSVEGGRITWSFGDGTTQDGRKVIHRYAHPGQYILRARIEHKNLFDEATVIVSVNPLAVSVFVPEHGEWVEVKNSSATILNLSGWRIRTQNQYFIIPEGTHILGNTPVRFDTSITKLTFLKADAHAFLLFPDGTTAMESSIFQDSMEEEVVEVQEPFIQTLEVATLNDVNQQPIVDIVKPTPSIQVAQEDKSAEKKPEESISAATANIAAASMALDLGENKGNGTLLWVALLGAILVLGVAGIVFARRNKSLADQFTIIEKHD